MYNWSTDIKHLKRYPEKYQIWRLEQLINFGLGEEKLKKTDLEKYWDKLNIDPIYKRYLSFLLWPKQY